MTILLQWLVEQAWIFYIVCGLGIIYYLVRALGARRERGVAIFTLERETATARMVQAWTMILVLVAIGALIFAITTYVLPTLPIYNADSPPPTPTLAAGVEPSTPVSTLTPSPTFGPAATVPPTTTLPAEVPPPVEGEVPEDTEAATPQPVEIPELAVSGEVTVGFGDFARLVGYGLPGTEFSTVESVPLTLVWQGLEGTSEANYLVFTHLLAGDGRLIAQHDGAPAGGTRPTSSWAPGETIVDEHPMSFAILDYTGPVRIAVGMYDPAFGRVPTETGSDRIILPVTIEVIAQ
jgi:hypothetical protein